MFEADNKEPYKKLLDSYIEEYKALLTRTSDICLDEYIQTAISIRISFLKEKIAKLKDSL